MARIERKKKASRKSIVIAVTVVALLAIAASYKGLQLKERNQAYMQQQEILESQIAEEAAREEELKEYAVYIKTKGFAEWYAREKMGLIYENEIIFEGE